MPLKKAGIHMGNTTASFSSFLASSKSAMLSLKSTKGRVLDKESEASTSTGDRPARALPHPCQLQLAASRMKEHLPFHVGILRYDVSLQSFHQIFVVACPVVFL